MELSNNLATAAYRQPVQNQLQQQERQNQGSQVATNEGLSFNQQQQVQQTNEESGANYDINKEASARNAQLVNILV